MSGEDAGETAAHGRTAKEYIVVAVFETVILFAYILLSTFISVGFSFSPAAREAEMLQVIFLV